MTLSRYHEILPELRRAFPMPEADPAQDSRLMSAISQALEQIGARKGGGPFLGARLAHEVPDRTTARIRTAQIQTAQLRERTASLEQVTAELVDSFDGVILGGHANNQMNWIAQPSIASVIAVALSSLLSPNLCSEEAAGAVLAAERRAAAMVARIIGYDPQRSAGLFTFGGTGALLYGVKIGLEKAVPDCLRKGLHGDTVIVASDQSHSACLNVAAWLGIGQDQVVKVPTHLDNSIDIAAIEATLHDTVTEGRKIAAIVATMGTTDAFGIDDLSAMYAARERLVERHSLAYRPHIHADAVTGWAWCMFNGYDTTENPLGFTGRTTRAITTIIDRMQHLHLADSVGVDFHKTGFAPYVSSLVSVRDSRDLKRLERSRDATPYLFHVGDDHPGRFTLETSRGAAGPLSALASLLLLGREGFQTLLGHSLEMAEFLRKQIDRRAGLTVLNGENFGPVIALSVFPDSVDTATINHRQRTDIRFRDVLLAHNRLNQQVYERMRHDALTGQGVALGLTRCYRSTDYGEPIWALKSCVMSPFAEERQIGQVVEQVLAAR